jgi:2-polyprenyl-6-methoxyphenol hydroxylase-like FAD-dependent oxidoreductase
VTTATNILDKREIRITFGRQMPDVPATEKMQTRCCIVGGGPAGMMLGFLLARAGVAAVVLEKHADFLRDFRGDTIHPSTLELMHELGILEEFLKRPHNQVREIKAMIGDTEIAVADFTHLPTFCKFIAFTPQWDFLNFIVEQAKHFSHFQLRMESEVTELIQDNGRVVGVKAKTSKGALEVRADLIVGADGRGSTVRTQARLEVIDLGAPMDVLWMRLSRRADDPAQSLGRINTGAILIMLNRGDYWQCGFVIRKGAFDEIKQNGLPAFHERLAKFAPVFRDRVGELDDWNKIRLLTVKLDRLRRWHRPGLLCIGDSAHAMSPIGGIGINLAIQDAVAAANILAEPLRSGTATEKHSAKIQRRRELPTRLTQRMQLFIQKRVISKVLKSDRPISPPKILRLFQHWPWLRRIPARVIGIGFRPEHIKTIAVKSGD